MVWSFRDSFFKNKEFISHRIIIFLFNIQFIQRAFNLIYTRTGLDVKTRELLVYSMLISLGGCKSQVKGHIQGNLNVGNNKETLLSVTNQLLPYIGYPRTLNAINCLNEVIPL